MEIDEDESKKSELRDVRTPVAKDYDFLYLNIC